MMNQPTGRRATVALTIEVLVEIPETEDYTTNVLLAKEELQKRLVEAKTFLPQSIHVDRIYSDVTVQELKNATVIPPHRAWTRPSAKR